MSGSEQFLGRQLSEQAEKLGLLVDKMGQMVIKQSESVPKYVEKSEELQKTFIGTIGQRPQETMTVFVTGSIRIVATVENSNATNAFSYKVTKNGVTVYEVGTNKLSTRTNTVDINVDEGDIIQTSVNHANDMKYVEDLKIYYSVIDKKDII